MELNDKQERKIFIIEMIKAVVGSSILAGLLIHELYLLAVFTGMLFIVLMFFSALKRLKTLHFN